MFQWKFNSLLAECKNKKINVTYRTLATDTKISTRALVGMSKNEWQRADAVTIHKLLEYFSGKLGRQVEFHELLEWDYTTVPPERKQRTRKPTN